MAQTRALRRELSEKTSVWTWLRRVYEVLFAGSVGLLLFWGGLQELLDTVGDQAVTQTSPALLAALLFAAARFGIWQGPVNFTVADCHLLLNSPLPRGPFVQRKLLAAWGTALTLGIVAGALIAAAATIGGSPGALSLICCVVGTALLFTLAASLSWEVQRSEQVAERFRRATPLICGAIGCLLIAGLVGGPSLEIAAWSGPWGWPLLGIVYGSSAGVAGLALGFALALVAAVHAWRRSASCALERFIARAGTRSILRAAVMTGDMRTAAVTHREAAQGLPDVDVASGGALGLPEPVRHRLLRLRAGNPDTSVVWRDLTHQVRARVRFALAAAVTVCGAIAVSTGDAGLSAAGLGVAYLGATSLLEPLRAEIDSPRRARLLLPWSFGRLLWLHNLLPLAVVTACGLLGVSIAALTGIAAPIAPIVALVVVAPVATCLVLVAALVARRGGRVPLMELMYAAAGDPMTGIQPILAFFAGPLAAVAAGYLIAVVFAAPSGAIGMAVACAGTALVTAVVALTARTELIDTRA